jgi:hypothetical protein
MEVLLDIKDKTRVPFFMELLRSFDYINVKEIARKRESHVISDLKEALNEVKLHEQGKIKLQNLNEFLDEL